MLSPGSRDWNGRVSKITAMLHPDPNQPVHPLTGKHREGGWPHLFVFRKCKNLIKEFDELMWKPEKNDAIIPAENTMGADHGIDAVGYALIEITQSAAKSPEELAEYMDSPAYALEQDRLETCNRINSMDRKLIKTSLF
jgi:hypothetical protein